MQLETERLIIRDILETDWESIHNYTSMTEVTQHTAWGPNTEEDTREYVQFVLDMQQTHPREGYELAICLKKEGILIGGVGLHIENTNAEIGYVLNPFYQGKGYAAEAARAMLGFGFNTLGIHRIYAKCRPNNKASENVMQKIGMQREGLMREHWFYKGEYHDSYLYSILAKEYAYEQFHGNSKS
ncbi:GNAT family N-acetyltransferase [Paenibacillus sp. 1781tsa1]|uniref:GNAT family N-acetyltransferase n=1 Tax=Paenibacillus sp. 1781tsa1 TaxID=2953810 RepID=UPI00209DD0EE|nr:GNAT family protein [Paenibacillus sp. 1781tsa1]MCP1181770.1 GNAT family N-acetyltransferase [Paenibacillus sp. 1781tsa1]